MLCNSETNIFKHKYDSVIQAVLLLYESARIVLGNNLSLIPSDNIITYRAYNEKLDSDEYARNILFVYNNKSELDANKNIKTSFDPRQTSVRTFSFFVVGFVDYFFFIVNVIYAFTFIINVISH